MSALNAVYVSICLLQVFIMQTRVDTWTSVLQESSLRGWIGETQTLFFDSLKNFFVIPHFAIRVNPHPGWLPYSPSYRNTNPLHHAKKPKKTGLTLYFCPLNPIIGTINRRCVPWYLETGECHFARQVLLNPAVAGANCWSQISVNWSDKFAAVC